MNYLNTFYLDKEKDVKIDFFKEDIKVFYTISTPNHQTDNLISNLAKLTNTKTSYDDKHIKVIKGEIPCLLTSHNDDVYIFRLNGIKIANIYEDGHIERRCLLPAISKVLMSQTKDYKLPLSKTLVKTYLPKEYKFKTDLHTHMNACLYPSVLLAFGITKQIRYPLYYVKKLELKLTKAQEKKLLSQRKKIAKDFVNSELVGKKLDRAIDDRTFINFADLILNNLKDADYNLTKVRNSLTLLKDGQAVFTNLEKLYLYRYVFTKGVISDDKIDFKNIDKIPHPDILKYVGEMLNDNQNTLYKNLSLYQYLLLWIGRIYQKQGIEYVEIADTNLVKSDGSAEDTITKIHEVMPLIEQETGVKIRFLAALRRIPLTIVKTNTTPANYLKDNLAVLKAISKDPYVVGCDFVGEEINDILELKPVISEIVKIAKNDPYFTIRIHAGENDSLIDNVSNAIKCVKESLDSKQKMPIVRLGHGLAIPSLTSRRGKQLLKLIKDNNVTLEFQLTSNVRLNNLSIIERHPLKEYLQNNVRCVQGTDGCGIYGTDSMDEQFALLNLLNLSEDDMKKMVKVERDIITYSNKSFKLKTRKFKRFLKDSSIKKALKEEIKKNQKKSKELYLDVEQKFDSKEVLKNKVSDFPLDKIPIIIAGGSFNSENRTTKMTKNAKKNITNLIKRLDCNKVFFVVGHKLEAYEKYLVENAKGYQIFAIVPAAISQAQKDLLDKANIKIVVSTESLGMGIYKSFNYEIFERRPSILIIFDGNSAGGNLIQEAKNGKAKSNIFVYEKSDYLAKKASTLKGYVIIFNDDDDLSLLINGIINKGI